MTARTDTMTAAEFQALLHGGKVPDGGITSTGNRKVRNAAKTEQDGIAFSKWRRESIKACGNTIVPQVALELPRQSMK